MFPTIIFEFFNFEMFETEKISKRFRKFPAAADSQKKVTTFSAAAADGKKKYKYLQPLPPIPASAYTSTREEITKNGP